MYFWIHYISYFEQLQTVYFYGTCAKKKPALKLPSLPYLYKLKYSWTSIKDKIYL